GVRFCFDPALLQVLPRVLRHSAARRACWPAGPQSGGTAAYSRAAAGQFQCSIGIESCSGRIDIRQRSDLRPDAMKNGAPVAPRLLLSLGAYGAPYTGRRARPLRSIRPASAPVPATDAG